MRWTAACRSVVALQCSGGPVRRRPVPVSRAFVGRDAATMSASEAKARPSRPPRACMTAMARDALVPEDIGDEPCGPVGQFAEPARAAGRDEAGVVGDGSVGNLVSADGNDVVVLHGSVPPAVGVGAPSRERRRLPGDRGPRFWGVPARGGSRKGKRPRPASRVCPGAPSRATGDPTSSAGDATWNRRQTA